MAWYNVLLNKNCLTKMADLGIIFLRRKHNASTDTSHYLQLLPEVCRSVIFGPPYICPFSAYTHCFCCWHWAMRKWGITWVKNPVANPRLVVTVPLASVLLWSLMISCDFPSTAWWNLDSLKAMARVFLSDVTFFITWPSPSSVDI